MLRRKIAALNIRDAEAERNRKPFITKTVVIWIAMRKKEKLEDWRFERPLYCRPLKHRMWHSTILAFCPLHQKSQPTDKQVQRLSPSANLPWWAPSSFRPRVNAAGPGAIHSIYRPSKYCLPPQTKTILPCIPAALNLGCLFKTPGNKYMKLSLRIQVSVERTVNLTVNGTRWEYKCRWKGLRIHQSMAASWRPIVRLTHLCCASKLTNPKGLQKMELLRSYKSSWGTLDEKQQSNHTTLKSVATATVSTTIISQPQGWRGTAGSMGPLSILAAWSRFEEVRWSSPWQAS